jgi:hypothetical protein
MPSRVQSKLVRLDLNSPDVEVVDGTQAAAEDAVTAPGQEQGAGETGEEAEGAAVMSDLTSLRPGDRVLVRKDNGKLEEHRVRHRPWRLGHGTWVVGLDGISGGYALSRVVAILEGP